MTLAIPLYFDPQTEATIRAVWEELAAQNISPFMAASGYRPHLTLAIYRDINRRACQELLSPLIDGLEPLPITFTHLGVFPTPDPVVFIAPTVTQPLLDLNREINRLLDAIGDEPVPYYLPGEWVPHCTVAVEFDASQVGRAVEVAQRMALPISGWASQLCLLEYPPVREIFNLPMKSLQEGRP